MVRRLEFARQHTKMAGLRHHLRDGIRKPAQREGHDGAATARLDVAPEGCDVERREAPPGHDGGGVVLVCRVHDGVVLVARWRRQDAHALDAPGRAGARERARHARRQHLLHAALLGDKGALWLLNARRQRRRQPRGGSSPWATRPT